MQNPLEALQEQCNTTSATNSHVVLQLEHAHALLLQFSEGLTEVSPWLEETQTLIGQLSLSTISYEAFREQQDLLQVKTEKTCLSTLAVLFVPFLSRSTKKSFDTPQCATIVLLKNEPLLLYIVHCMDCMYCY